MNFPKKSILTGLTLFGLAASAFASGDTPKPGKDSKKEEYQVRFLCSGTMPDRLFLASDKPDEAQEITLSQHVVSPLQHIPKASVKGGVIDLLAGYPQVNGAVMEIRKKPFAKLTFPPNKPHLVCFFKPFINGKSGALHQLVVDISPETVPAGSCVIVNVAAVPAIVALGQAGKPVTIAAQTTATLPLPPAEADGRTLVRMAIRDGKKYTVLNKSALPLPSDGRTLITIASVNPVTHAGSPGEFETVKLD